MDDSYYYRQKAERCRALLEVAVVPEIREQLRLWEREFDDIAEAMQRREERRVRASRWRRFRSAIGRA